MKKQLIGVLSVALLAVANAGAFVITVDRVDGYYRGGGGEFNITPITGHPYASSVLYNNTLGDRGFASFCLERDVPLPLLPGQYNAVVNAAGVVQNDNDPISVGTAFLYYQFATGVLTGYDYVNHFNSVPGAEDSARAAKALVLQLAFYQLEGEVSNQTIGNNQFLSLLNTTFSLGGDLTSMYVNNNGTYNVGVLNITDLQTGADRQDQLVLLPDGGASLLLLGMGLLGLGAFRRRA